MPTWMEMVKYECSRFNGGTVGGRGFCMNPNCNGHAAWMRKQKDNRWRSYCDACAEHESHPPPTHDTERGI